MSPYNILPPPRQIRPPCGHLLEGGTPQLYPLEDPAALMVGILLAGSEGHRKYAGNWGE